MRVLIQDSLIQTRQLRIRVPVTIISQLLGMHTIVESQTIRGELSYQIMEGVELQTRTTTISNLTKEIRVWLTTYTEATPA